ncbi:MAG: isocitrate lyase/phosphoenolpyruvate mutase family protein [Acidimicrobiia bacterium]
MPESAGRRERFSELHESGIFLMPNAWDAGSARLFESLGFPAVATTSSGFAATLGRLDQNVTRDELVAHVESIAGAVDIPVSVDSEDGYADDVAGLAETVELLAAVGAAGLSIEDYRPGHGILPLDTATERVSVFVEHANRHGLTVTARAENHLYGAGDLDDTLRRLSSYAAAGAHVVYAPGLIQASDLSRVVSGTPRPANALLMPAGPTVAEMGEIGVRRLSTGGALTWVAYGSAARAARELLREGTQTYAAGMLPGDDRERAWGTPESVLPAGPPEDAPAE